MQIPKAIYTEENLKKVNGGSIVQWVEIWFLSTANLQSKPQFCHQLYELGQKLLNLYEPVSSCITNGDSAGYLIKLFIFTEQLLRARHHV